MRSILRFLQRVFTGGKAGMSGSPGNESVPPPAPTDVTLLVPAMN
jgi:hypothetical protein